MPMMRRDADVKYLAPNQCPPDYDDVLCAGGTGENTCSGDSGEQQLQIARKGTACCAFSLKVNR